MVLGYTLAAAVLLSLVHVFVGKFRFLSRNVVIWNSVAGGIGISYAFLVLLPKIAAAQPALQAAADVGILGYLNHHAYLVALAGLVFYYGMDAAVSWQDWKSPWRRSCWPWILRRLSGVWAS